MSIYQEILWSRKFYTLKQKNIEGPEMLVSDGWVLCGVSMAIGMCKIRHRDDNGVAQGD